MQSAKTEKEKNDILTKAVETLKKFEKKLQKCNGL
jgi:hypothetical protein